MIASLHLVVIRKTQSFNTCKAICVTGMLLVPQAQSVLIYIDYGHGILDPWFADGEGQSLECLVFPNFIEKWRYFFSLWFLPYSSTEGIVIFLDRQLKGCTKCLGSGGERLRKFPRTTTLEWLQSHAVPLPKSRLSAGKFGLICKLLALQAQELEFDPQTQ